MEDIKNWESKFQACKYSDQLLNLIVDLNSKVRIPTDINIIKKACFYARLYHGDQERKSKDPYYSHPLIVAYLFALYVGNNMQRYYTIDLIVIAILHDTIEDTKLTYKMIEEIFNRNVADGVKDLSRITTDDLKTSAGDTLLSLYAQSKYGLLLVKMFDRLHNTQTLEFKSLDKRWKTIRENAEFFIFLAMVLGRVDLTEELKRLSNQGVSIANSSSFGNNFLLAESPLSVVLS